MKFSISKEWSERAAKREEGHFIEAGILHPVHTPPDIRKLEKNQIFVFGSNLAGRHGKGAAKTAKMKFGAIQGVGEGLTGRCYALPTKDQRLRILPLWQIEIKIGHFLRFAMKNPQLQFLTTLVGCGLAGYHPDQIGTLFSKFNIPINVTLPIEFSKHIKS